MTEKYFEYLTPILDNYIIFEDGTKIQVADLVYNFGKNENAHFYKAIFDKFRDIVYNDWNDLHINPSFVFFVNDKSNNAFGGKADESGMIGINYGLVDSIINIVNKNRDYLHTSTVGKVLELSGLPELNIESIISQACLLFLFYHELGHVIQQSETPKQMMREKIESEDKTPNGYASHVLETDSDEFADTISKTV